MAPLPRSILNRGPEAERSSSWVSSSPRATALGPRARARNPPREPRNPGFEPREPSSEPDLLFRKPEHREIRCAPGGGGPRKPRTGASGVRSRPRIEGACARGGGELARGRGEAVGSSDFVPRNGIWRSVAAMMASFVRYMLTPVEATSVGCFASKPDAASRSSHASPRSSSTGIDSDVQRSPRGHAHRSVVRDGVGPVGPLLSHDDPLPGARGALGALVVVAPAIRRQAVRFARAPSAPRRTPRAARPARRRTSHRPCAPRRPRVRTRARPRR